MSVNANRSMRRPTKIVKVMVEVNLTFPLACEVFSFMLLLFISVLEDERRRTGLSPVIVVALFSEIHNEV